MSKEKNIDFERLKIGLANIIATSNRAHNVKTKWRLCMAHDHP